MQDGPATAATLATLDTLPIKGRAPMTGYNRELFGPAWSDDVTVPDGHNGCDTRNDILRRDLVDVEIKPQQWDEGKRAYGLWITQAEHDAIARIPYSGCSPPPPGDRLSNGRAPTR